MKGRGGPPAARYTSRMTLVLVLALAALVAADMIVRHRRSRRAAKTGDGQTIVIDLTKR